MTPNQLKQWRAKRLDEAVKFAFEDNKAELGRQLGFKDGSYVGQLIRMQRPIDEELIYRIEKLSPRLHEWFRAPEPGARGSAAPRSNKMTPESPAIHPSAGAHDVDTAGGLRRMTAVPVVGEVKGGEDGFLEELQYPVGNGEGFVEYPTADANAYALRVRGDSMHPRYRAGEFVVVEPSVEPQQGDDVVVICKNGRKLLKQLNWIRDGEVQLLSINDTYQPLTMDLREIDAMHLVGGRARRSSLRHG